MKRTPEHEAVIDELVEKSGLDRELVAKFTDALLEKMIQVIVAKVAEKLDDYLYKGGRYATGGVVRCVPLGVPGDGAEFVVPK